MAALSIRRPISGLSRSIVELQRAFAAIHRITWTVSAYNRETGGQKTDLPIQSIELDKVSFSYDGRRDILKQVSLAIGKGEHIAIMGKSGAGKTTLSDLINGFYPCTAGDIRVNGISMAQLDPAHWRDIIGIVSQEPFLFNLSIKDNIRLGNFSVSDPEIEDALKAAGCGEMLERLPDGIDSMVGERGGVLSGGERKRVALARIFVRKPALMILDEATSELDGQTEHRILETIANWQPRPMVLNISHRQSILDFCDRVWVVSEGRIEEVDKKQAHQLVRSKQFSDDRVDDRVLQAMGSGSHRRQDRASSESPGGWSASSKPPEEGSASVGDPRSASSGKSE